VRDVIANKEVKSISKAKHRIKRHQ